MVWYQMLNKSFLHLYPTGSNHQESRKDEDVICPGPSLSVNIAMVIMFSRGVQVGIGMTVRDLSLGSLAAVLRT